MAQTKLSNLIAFWNMQNIGFIKKELRNRGGGGGGGGYSVLINYQSLRFKYRSFSPSPNYLSLLNIDEMDYFFWVSLNYDFII